VQDKSPNFMVSNQTTSAPLELAYLIKRVHVIRVAAVSAGNTCH